MGLIIKSKEIAKGVKNDIYLKIDSVMAWSNHNTITVNCGEWIGTASRAEGYDEFKANVPYFIPNDNIKCNGGSLIDAVYPPLKLYFEELGHTVINDLNNYGADLQAKIGEEIYAKK